MKHRQLITPARSNKRKRFVALARVSSREQEREGFSLDVQVEARERYTERSTGEIVKMIGSPKPPQRPTSGLRSRNSSGT
jgi:predicted site-specific integrase-resolvase